MLRRPRWKLPRARVPALVSRGPSPGGALVLALFIVVASVVSSSCQTFPTSSGVRTAFEPDIRVRIRAGIKEVTLSGPRRLQLNEPAYGRRIIDAPARIDATSEGFTITDARGSAIPVRAGLEVRITNADPRTAGAVPTVLVDGAAFPGSLIPIPRSSGAAPSLDLVEELPLEEYLPGVLAIELYQQWPLETFKAQAVAARSYALHERRRSIELGEDFDVEGSTLDQAYAGATKNPTPTAAVRATRGLVLTERGQILRAYYSSTCGGRANSAADVWPVGKGYEFNLAGPIQGRTRDFACEGSPLFRWTVERALDDVEQRLRAWGEANGSALRRLGRLASIKATRFNPVTDRPIRFQVTDHEGRRVLIKSEDLRVALNYRAPTLASPDRPAQVRSGDLEVTISGNRATIAGRGFGHGVGMCQFCAKGFADEGKPYQEMLKAFYAGARIERAY